MTTRDIKIWLIFLLTFIVAGLFLGFLIVLIQKSSGLGKIHPIILGAFGGLFGGIYGPKYAKFLNKKIK
tara:strand:+ start:303 stop:509 length:207 start_codon:yes stop_codon:yes gene_type:complete